jgi:hypothetical protein
MLNTTTKTDVLHRIQRAHVKSGQAMSPWTRGVDHAQLEHVQHSRAACVVCVRATVAGRVFDLRLVPGSSRIYVEMVGPVARRVFQPYLSAVRCKESKFLRESLRKRTHSRLCAL